MKTKKINVYKNFVFLFIILVLGIFSYYLIFSGFNTYVEKKVVYSESSDVDYRVYYYDNDFFDTDYLEKDKTYISSLIDYMDFKIDYKANFSNVSKGDYVYYVNATIIASNPSDENQKYWSKTINILEPKIVKYNDKDSFEVSTNFKLDYQLYNNILKEFRSEYNLAFVGKLKVELFVESSNNFSELKNPIKLNSSSVVSIPLTQQTINLNVEYSNVNKQNDVVEREQLIDFYDKLYITIGSILMLISLLLLCAWIIINRDYLKNQTEYNKIKNKILKTYDAIIVNVYEVPSFKNMKVVNVKLFDELLDAQNEVRMPINFIELVRNRESKFMLISDNIVWIYTLIDEKINGEYYEDK